jgi:hypothetical protein
MGFFNKIISGGPQFVDQNLFNSYIYTTYMTRYLFEDFDKFWKGELITPEGKKFKNIDGLIEFNSSYPKDSFLNKSLGKTLVELDKYYLSKYELTYSGFSILRKIVKISNEIDTNGEKIKIVGRLFAESHPNPEIRSSKCLEDFKTYEKMI